MEETGHEDDERESAPCGSPWAAVWTAVRRAGVDVRGGGPGTRETDLLDTARTVAAVDAIVLSGGSAFGLDAASGVQAFLRETGRGYAVGTDNQVTTDGTWTYTYDAVGNLTQKSKGAGLETWYYTYDDENHLTVVRQTTNGTVSVGRANTACVCVKSKN